MIKKDRRGPKELTKLQKNISVVNESIESLTTSRTAHTCKKVGRDLGRHTSSLQDSVGSSDHLRNSLENWVLGIDIADDHKKMLETRDVERDNLRDVITDFWQLIGG